MTLLNIPLQPVPNQSVSFLLNGASYTIDVDTRLENIYISIFQDGAYVLRNRALRAYAPVGFDLQLADTLGTDDPVYTGLGSRWLLMGLEQ
jgi:hypothetical protein